MRSREDSRAPSVTGCEFMRKSVTGGAFIAAARFVQDSGTRATGFPSDPQTHLWRVSVGCGLRSFRADNALH